MINMSLEHTRMPMQDPKVRKRNFEEAALGYTEQIAIREAMRCLRCRKHPCMSSGCPVHNHIPEFIEKITEGDFEGAYQILAQTTSLPAVCGRVCPQYLQCEGKCVRGKNGQPVAIGALERFVADWHREHFSEESVTEMTQDVKNAGKKIAVIGSGPAGLACAGDLLKLGYSVTVFEKEDVLGGVLAYGIPKFRLPREILEREIKTLYSMGMQTECGKALGSDFTIDGLLNSDGYDAVFLANGAGKPVDMDIPGCDASGVITASEFLEKENLEKNLPEAKQIVIVGGGNVAMDACRCAARIPSAEKVTIVYRRSRAEMPADPTELAEAIDEGVDILYLTCPVAVEGSDGRVTGLRCQKMQLSEPDASGRKTAVPVPDSEFVLPADLIVEAIGSRSDNACADGVNLSGQKGYVLVDPDTCQTSMSGVFAGGDTVTGPKTVISAMGAGKKAAKAIDEYLNT